MSNASITGGRTRTAHTGIVRGSPSSSRTGAEPGSYYAWTVRQLRKRAKELGLSGYSALTKEDLIYKLRHH